MDISAMKKDLTACLNSLPPGMINPKAVAAWVLANKPNLELVIPAIIDKMQPHFMAAAMESAMGVIDKDEIERACIECLMTYGLPIPAEALADGSHS